MKALAELTSLHAEIDAILEAQRPVAADANDAAVVDRLEAKQRLNDQAYYVLCWGQFETALDERCRHAIRTGQGHADWKRRRIWQMFNPDDRRFSGLRFEDRAGLLLDRAAGPARPMRERSATTLSETA